MSPVSARASWHRIAGRSAVAEPQAVPPDLRHPRPDGFRDAVPLSRARHRRAAEPAGAQRRDRLDRRAAPLDGVGGCCSSRCSRRPRRRWPPSPSCIIFQDIAQTPAAPCPPGSSSSAPITCFLPRRQQRWHDRRGRAAHRPRRHRAGAAHGGAAALRAHRADGGGGDGDRAGRRGLASVHSGRQPGRRRLPRDRPATPGVAAADDGLGGDRRDRAWRRRVSRRLPISICCRPR